jgi:peptide/nickel transport system substrate-binding protein
VLGVLLSGISVACAPAAPQSKEKTLTIGLGGETTSLNSNIGQGGGTALGITLFEAMFNNLVQPDPATGQVSPELATEWKVLDDKLTWQFKLRQGVKFQNGEEVTAEAVKVSLDDILNSKTAVSNAKRRMAAVESVEVVDKYTFNVKTKTPSVLLPISLADAFVYPPKYYTETGPDPFSDKPVGSGQFKFAQWTKGTSITLQANPDYWGPRSKIDKLVFKPYPEASSRVAALERGEIDIASNVPPDEGARLQSKGFQILWSPLGQAMLVHLTPIPGTPLEDKRVRQALNYAVDKEAIIKNVLLGYGTILKGELVGPDGIGYNPALDPYPYDLAKAKQLLADAGYPSGFSVKFQCSEGRYAKQKEVCEAIVGQLAQVGVKFDLEMSEWGTFVNRVVTNAPERAATWYIGLNYYPAMDADFIISSYITTSPLKQFSNAKLDDLYAQQSREFDPQKRLTILQEFMAVVRDEAPDIFLFQAPDIYAVSKRVQGYKPTPDNYLHLENVSLAD